MAERLRPEAFDRVGWLREPERPDAERQAEIRERWLLLGAAVTIGIVNIIIVAAAFWHPTSTFELTPLLPK
jgi:hypothetical protein